MGLFSRLWQRLVSRKPKKSKKPERPEKPEKLEPPKSNKPVPPSSRSTITRVSNGDNTITTAIMVQQPPSGGSRKISFNVSDQYEIQDVIGEGAYGVVW